jgi:hypothetical protein
MMNVQITDENFIETRETLMLQTDKRLEGIARRFQMKNIESYSRTQLIDKIVSKIKNVMISKYQPQSVEQLEKITKLLVESLITTPANRPKNRKMEKKEKSKNLNLIQLEVDPFEKLKIKNLAGKFMNKKDRKIVKRKCKVCTKEYDNIVVRWPDELKDEFECPRCIILNNDPLNEVVNILYEPSILKSNKNFTFKLSYEDYTMMSKNPKIGVEIRTLKLNGKYFYQQTWPDKCSLRVNGKIVKEVEPLNQNSSLKKRRDQKLFNRFMSRVGTNTLNISFKNIKDGKNTKVDYDPHYVFCILLVRKRSVDELSKKIRLEKSMTVEEGKQFIIDKFTEQKDVEISEIKADLLCKITYTFVKNPARGEFCTHLDCFNLDFFLKSMEQNLMRRWICPLCRKRCLNLKVDKYFEEIIEQVSKLEDSEEYTKVFFKKDGSFIFGLDEFEQNEAFGENTVANTQNALMVDHERKKLKNSSNVFEILSITSEGDSKDLKETMIPVGDKGTNEIMDIRSSSISDKLFNHSKENRDQEDQDDFNCLRKRPSSFSTQRIKMNKNYRHDKAFLEKFWKHYESKKITLNKDLEETNFEEFKANFLNLCEEDVFFSKKVALLYKFVLIRRKETQNEIVMRYNRILDEASGQPNWIYGLKDKANTSNFLSSSKGNKILKSGQNNDNELLKSLLDDYTFEHDDSQSQEYNGMDIEEVKNLGSKNTPIEII